MRLRISKASVALVAVLGMAGACGGESTNDGGGACEDPVCCAPVEFDAARSRAYLVGDYLELYLATRGEVYAADQLRFVWVNEGQVDASVSSSATETTVCDRRTDSSAAGLNGQHCSLPLSSKVSCGQELIFDIGFRSTLRAAESDESVCSAAPFSTRIVWTAVVQCAECGPAVSPISACDHPASQTCSYQAGGSPFCAADMQLPCYCGFNTLTGERHWQCAVC